MELVCVCSCSRVDGQIVALDARAKRLGPQIELG